MLTFACKDKICYVHHKIYSNKEEILKSMSSVLCDNRNNILKGLM